MRIHLSRRARRAVPAAVGAVAVAVLATNAPANAERVAAIGPAAETVVAPAAETVAERGIPVRAGIGSVRADGLAAELGPQRTAGVYFDRKTERMVVTVTDAAAERAVTAAGGVAKRVKHSVEDLNAVRKALDERIDTRGTTWGTAVDDNVINVTADSTVSEVDFAEMVAVLAPFGGAARLTRLAGQLDTSGPVNGGKYMRNGSGGTCSVGFNVQKKSDPTQKYVITAGHCTVLASGEAKWYNGANVYFGYDAGGRYPGTDYGLIRHNNPVIDKPGNVYWHGSGQVTDITHSRDPGFGEYVCQSGWVLGTYCGTVYELDVTAHYREGNVYGLFRTDHCVSDGDSGGPIFHGGAALGIHSGRNTSGCIAYHQRVNPALAWYGVEVY